MEVRRPCGADYLAAVTDLLHDVRRSGLDAGLWEAADAQWWYPRDPHPQPDAATFWYDDDRPVAATVFTRWNPGLCGAVVFGDQSLDVAWHEVGRGLAVMPDADVDMEIGVGDGVMLARARAHGFVEETDRIAVGRAVPAHLLPAAPLPAGLRIVARPGLPGPHPLSVRNGSEVERHLGDCSLYDPDCDLAIVTDDGDIAGYALFWPDPVTGVGLVEPVRVEDAYAGRGLATTLVQTGVELLARRGCRHLKVAYGLDNPARARVYERAGFTQQSESVVLRRPKPRSAHCSTQT